VKILGRILINPLCVVAKAKESPQFLKSLLSGSIAMWPLCTKLAKQFQRDKGDDEDIAFSRERQQSAKKQLILICCWFAKPPGTSVGQKFSTRICHGTARRLGVFIGFAYLRPFRFFMNA
jgi:hypothetical protein